MERSQADIVGCFLHQRRDLAVCRIGKVYESDESDGGCLTTSIDVALREFLLKLPIVWPVIIYSDVRHTLALVRCDLAKNISINLGEHFDGFITQQIESGRYGSASKVVRAGIRMLENAENKLETLRRLLKEGEDSSIAGYSYETFIAELDEDAN